MAVLRLVSLLPLGDLNRIVYRRLHAERQRHQLVRHRGHLQAVHANEEAAEEGKSEMTKKQTRTGMLLAGLLASSFLVRTVDAQSPAPVAQPPAASAPFRYLPNRIPRQAVAYYGLVWGVGSLSVKLVESGEIIRFRYTVLDPEKAKPLNDKKSEPSLIDPQVGVSLVVPSLEQVGQLRQSSLPEEGKSYWMAFSNSGRRVKRGDRVDVVIGQFHADGLIVE
jgi:hypothetical protein